MHTNDTMESPRGRASLGCATSVLLAATALLIIAVGWLFVEVGRLQIPDELSIITLDRKFRLLRSDADENSRQTASLASDLSYLGTQTASLASELSYVGSLASNANAYAHSHTYSDGRLKRDIAPIENALADILSVSGIRFHWRHDLQEDLPQGSQIGVVAQQLEQVYPELVHTSSTGYKQVDYAMLAPILIEAIREQQEQIDQLKEEVSVLREQLAIAEPNPGSE